MPILSKYRFKICLYSAVVLCALTLFNRRFAQAQGLLPWKGEIFEGKPAEMLSAAKELEPDVFDSLLNEQVLYIDKRHRVQRTIRRVYYVKSRDSIESMATINAEWVPWLESRPEIRARVISPNGKEYWLDAKTLTESAAENVSNQTYRDNRLLTGPLPAVSLGSIVETEIVVKEHTSFCSSGIAGGIYTETFTRDRTFHRSILADKEIGLSLLCIGNRIPIETRTIKDQTAWSYVQHDMKPIEVLREFRPDDVPLISQVRYGTGASWAEIAKYYEQLIEPQLVSDDVATFADTIRSKGGDKRQQVLNALQAIFDSVRYTGVQFGERSIQPARPAQTLLRRFGDCKDQATLMVTLLRALKIDASLALLYAGESDNVYADIVGLNAFNHAIVYLPKQDGIESMWIDMTAPHIPFGDLPITSKNRNALVVDSNTLGLVKATTRGKAKSNWTHHHHYELFIDKPSKTTSRLTVDGDLAAEYRLLYLDQTASQLKQTLHEAYEQERGLTRVDDCQLTNCRDVAIDGFELSYSYQATKIADLVDGKLSITFNVGGIFQRLPDEFIWQDGDASRFDGSDPPPRQIPFKISPAFASVYQYQVDAPEGFVFTETPEATRFEVGPIEVELTSRLVDHSLRFTATLDTGDGLLSVKEANDFREELFAATNQTAPSQWAIPITMVYEPRQKIADGNVLGGLRQMMRHTDQSHQSVFRRSELAKTLLTIGLGQEAREIADAMVLQHPESAEAYRTAGWVYLHDLLGRELAFGMNRARAIESLEKAYDLDPNTPLPQHQIALLLQHDANGGTNENKADFDRAIEIYQDMLDKHQLDIALINLTSLLARRGDLAELRKLSRLYPQHPETTYMRAAVEADVHGIRVSDKTLQSLDTSIAKSRVAFALRLRQQRQYKDLVRLRDAFPNQIELQEFLLLMKKYEDVTLDPESPASALQQFLAQWMYSGNNLQVLRKFFVKSASDSDFYRFVESAPLGMYGSRQRILEEVNDPRVARDLVSLYEFSVAEESKHGCKVIAVPRGEIGLTAFTATVTREDGEYRIVPAGFRDSLWGEFALRAVEANNLEAANFWMQETMDFEKQFTLLLDPFRSSPFANVYALGKTGNEKAIHLAALMLSGRQIKSEKERKKLRLAIEAMLPEFPELIQLHVNRYLMLHHAWSGQHEKALEIMEERLQVMEDSPHILATRFDSELALNRIKEAEATLRLIKASSPRFSLRLQQELILNRDGIQANVQHLNEGADVPTETNYVDRAISWRSLFLPNAPSVIEHAESVVAKASSVGELIACRHTLACAYANEGNILRAHASLCTLLEARNGHFDPIDNLVLGRIAQQIGLSDAADKYYDLVINSTSERATIGGSISAIALAKLWRKKTPGETISETDLANTPEG